MHQYRLLRDNKESGPYTASDLQVMGLKPYDLIWQEGKSAAWRYPGELDELKAFAPPVEEQPYDRFYKKPEPAKSALQEFAPRPATSSEPTTVIRKGHIVVTMPTTLTRERNQPVVKQEPVYQRQVQMMESVPSTSVESPRQNYVAASSMPVASPSSPRMLTYLVAAASILLIGSLVVLMVNNNIQNKKITQLRDIVTQMQQTQPNPGSDPLNQQVVHYPTEQQSASIIIPIDTTSRATQNLQESKPQVSIKSKISRSNQVASTTPLPVDSDLVKPVKFEKPIIEPSGDKRVAVKRDDISADNNLMQLVKVNTNDYKTGLLGGINNLKITLLNKSLVALKKVEVQIDYLGPESRIVKSQTVFFENVAPGEDLLLEVPKSNRGVKVTCVVKKIIT
jgi:hypothetical protein